METETLAELHVASSKVELSESEKVRVSRTMVGLFFKVLALFLVTGESKGKTVFEYASAKVRYSWSAEV